MHVHRVDLTDTIPISFNQIYSFVNEIFVLEQKILELSRKQNQTPQSTAPEKLAQIADAIIAEYSKVGTGKFHIGRFVELMSELRQLRT